MIFSVALVLILAAHLLCVNVAAAGPIVSAWLEWRQARDRRLAEAHGLAARVNLVLAALAPLALLAGGVLGVLLGLLTWSSGLAEAVAAMPGKIQWAGPEYVFSLVLMAIYYLWLKRVPCAGGAQMSGRAFLAVVAGTNLLYHFPFLFVVLASVADSPQVVSSEIDAAAFRGWMIRGPVLAQVTHFLLASFAVTGVVLLILALRILRIPDGEPEANRESAARIARWGGWWALVPTLLQFPVGFWLLIEQPPEVARAVMGGHPAGSLALAGSVLAVLVLLHHLGSIVMGQYSAGLLRRTIALMVAVVVLMTGVLYVTHADRFAAPQVSRHAPAGLRPFAVAP